MNKNTKCDIDAHRLPHHRRELLFLVFSTILKEHKLFHQEFSRKAGEGASPERKDVWWEIKNEIELALIVEEAGEEANQGSRKHPLGAPHWTSTGPQCAQCAMQFAHTCALNTGHSTIRYMHFTNVQHTSFELQLHIVPCFHCIAMEERGLHWSRPPQASLPPAA